MQVMWNLSDDFLELPMDTYIFDIIEKDLNEKCDHINWNGREKNWLMYWQRMGKATSHFQRKSNDSKVKATF